MLYVHKDANVKLFMPKGLLSRRLSYRSLNISAIMCCIHYVKGVSDILSTSNGMRESELHEMLPPSGRMTELQYK